MPLVHYWKPMSYLNCVQIWHLNRVLVDNGSFFMLTNGHEKLCIIYKHTHTYTLREVHNAERLHFCQL